MDPVLNAGGYGILLRRGNSPAIHIRGDDLPRKMADNSFLCFQSWIFLAGASGMIVGNYLTTQGRDIGMDMDMIQSVQEFS